MKRKKMPGIVWDSPRGDTVEALLVAVEKQDYHVARVCLINLVHGGNGDPRVLSSVIQLIHEQEPPK